MSVTEPPRSRDSEGRRLGRILVEEPAIARRNDELAQAIRRDLPDDEPVLVGLTGTQWRAVRIFYASVSPKHGLTSPLPTADYTV